MKKRLFVLLIVLMSLSLIGIIFVQGYWINNTVKNNEKRFSLDAKSALASVANKVQYKEFERYYFPFRSLIDSLKKPDLSTIDRLLLDDTRDDAIGEIFVYANGLIEEDYKLSESFRKPPIDAQIYSTDSAAQLDDKIYVDENLDTPESRLGKLSKLGDYEKQLFEKTILELANRIPIHQRIDKEELKRLLNREFSERELPLDYEFAVYSNSLATRVRSDNFKLLPSNIYTAPLFKGANEKDSQYELYVNFTSKKKYLIASVTNMAALSIIFTLIIIVAYSSALSQLMLQRQISQIKTDFINNMTHELKTPIATINLALDAMKNPKITADMSKMKRYLGMIREENKRMHAQVENVLRISKLEKNQLDIKKERLELHELIEEAITHVELIVEDRNGYIKSHLGALRSSILANDVHFTNVIVNVLDNAVKYSEGEPKIDIYTENVKNSIVLKVRDQGIGMSKTAQKKIFEKFFREHTGDIHNVKGHGLGLTYVKRIVDDHHGQIWVESEKGKGTTITLKLPLIS